MKAAYTSLRQFFDDRELKFRMDVDEQMIMADFSSRHARYRIVAKIDDKWDLLQLFAEIPVFVPEHRRQVVAEILTRANWGIKIGKFELDMRDGEVRYQSSTAFEGDLSSGVTDLMLNVTLSTADRYFPAIMAGICGAEPKQALEDAERQFEAHLESSDDENDDENDDFSSSSDDEDE